VGFVCDFYFYFDVNHDVSNRRTNLWREYSKLKHDYFNQNKIATIWLPLVKNLYQFPVKKNLLIIEQQTKGNHHASA
jgi:hypothetical protein